MLKQVEYPCDILPVRGFPKFYKAVYVIINNKCYFSGIEHGSSTVNTAENIIMAIVKQENVSLANLRYFDIWTRRGYQMFLPGEYRVSELKFKMRRWSTGSIPEVIRWEQTKLSADVFKLFEKLIGIDLKTMYAGVWRESEGLIGVHDENLRFFYVYPDGKPVFKERYVDMTEFKDGLAWVNKGNNQWAQIDHQGNIKSKWIDGKELRGF